MEKNKDMNLETKYIIDQMVKKKQYKKDNGPIELTADQLWKYSGKIEDTNPDFASYEIEKYTKRWRLRK